jgi:hypothetical protein
MTAINAVKAINMLRESGFNDAQAAAVVEAIAESIDAMTATKLDLANSTHELRQEMVALRSELAADITQVGQSVTKLESAMKRLIAESGLKTILWIGAIVVFAAGAYIAHREAQVKREAARVAAAATAAAGVKPG